MTGCDCITCLYSRARADRAPGRRHLRPLISPAAASRDASAGFTTKPPAGSGPRTGPAG